MPLEKRTKGKMTDEIQRLLDEAERIGLAISKILHDEHNLVNKRAEKINALVALENRMRIGTNHHCQHLRDDGTFVNGFTGCVAHMMSKCGGSHNEFHAKALCGMIAHRKDEAHG